MAKKIKDEQGNTYVQKKPIYKKWWFWLIIAIFAIGALTPDKDKEEAKEKSGSNTKQETKVEKKESKNNKKDTKKASEKEEAKKNNSKNKNDLVTKVNKDVAKHIKFTQDLALGHIDKNGKPVENAEPDGSSAWSMSIVKVEYTNNNQLDVYVKNDFKSLSTKEKSDTITKVQNITNVSIQNYKDVSLEDSRKGFLTTIYIGENSIGQSKISNHKEYNWD